MTDGSDVRSKGWPESAVREVAVLNEALENAEAEVERLREREAEADRLLRVAYADAHSEDVPAAALLWLNPETPRAHVCECGDPGCDAIPYTTASDITALPPGVSIATRKEGMP